MMKRLTSMTYTDEKDGKIKNYEYKIRNFKDYNNIWNKQSLGTYLRKTVDAIVGKGLQNSISDVVVNYNFGFANRNNFVGLKLQEDLRVAMGKETTTVDDFISIIYNSKYGLLPKLSVHPSLFATGVANIELLTVVHGEQAYYLSWMQSMDSNYVDGAVATFSDGNDRCYKFNCPVNVYAYDSQNKLVASIVNEKVQDIKDSSIIASIDENGQKVM